MFNTILANLLLFQICVQYMHDRILYARSIRIARIFFFCFKDQYPDTLTHIKTIHRHGWPKCWTHVIYCAVFDLLYHLHIVYIYIRYCVSRLLCFTVIKAKIEYRVCHTLIQISVDAFILKTYYNIYENP